VSVLPPVPFLLCDVLLRPACVEDFSLSHWDTLLQQARGAGLLARVALLINEALGMGAAPEPVRWHLDSAVVLYRAHCADIRLEISHLQRALGALDQPLILLKGAAYLAADDRAVIGRLYSDVDIFLPRDRLEAATQILCWQGWVEQDLSAYDRAYYARWMHEIPPMAHRARGIALDVHHNLLPLTSRLALDAKLLLQGVQASTIAGVYVLAPEDRVLHSAAHLLLDGEFDNAFRDLSDLYLLLSQFTEDPAFWCTLTQRAQQLGLAEQLGYALYLLAALFGLMLPEAVAAGPCSPARRGVRAVLVRRLLARAVLPIGIQDGWQRSLAQSLLYLRSHYLKMPLPLLIRHLAHKAFITPFEYRDDADGQRRAI
jgi:hypothetical protein